MRVEYTPPQPSIRIRADVEQLRGAFMNLCRNAMQAMLDGGWLEVERHPAGRMVDVSITDNGVGISAENLERIFEPYFTTREDGTGLGLAEVDRVIREHDGFVRVSSQPGEGSLLRGVTAGCIAHTTTCRTNPQQKRPPAKPVEVCRTLHCS